MVKLNAISCQKFILSINTIYWLWNKKTFCLQRAQTSTSTIVITLNSVPKLKKSHVGTSKSRRAPCTIKLLYLTFRLKSRGRGGRQIDLSSFRKFRHACAASRAIQIAKKPVGEKNHSLPTSRLRLAWPPKQAALALVCTPLPKDDLSRAGD